MNGFEQCSNQWWIFKDRKDVDIQQVSRDPHGEVEAVFLIHVYTRNPVWMVCFLDGGICDFNDVLAFLVIPHV